jgi:hypothetical protein
MMHDMTKFFANLFSQFTPLKKIIPKILVEPPEKGHGGGYQGNTERHAMNMVARNRRRNRIASRSRRINRMREA